MQLPAAASITRAIVMSVTEGTDVSLALLRVASSVRAQPSATLAVSCASDVLFQAVETQEHVAVLL